MKEGNERLLYVKEGERKVGGGESEGGKEDEERVKN